MHPLAEEFLKKKIDTPTEKWDDLKWGEYAYAFTVAHSNEAAVLDAIHGLLNKAIKEGLGFQAFRNGMVDMMKDKGWYGGAGHTADDKKYINWRIKTIYETNMRTAYAQAQYRKQLQGAALRPIWVYQSQLAGKNRRQEHIALHGKAYRYDDPFWDRYYPPNGWGCRCYVTTKSEAGAERDGIKAGDSTKETVPEIDETWAYNAGREALAPNFAKYAIHVNDIVHHRSFYPYHSIFNFIGKGINKIRQCIEIEFRQFKFFHKLWEGQRTGEPRNDSPI